MTFTPEESKVIYQSKDGKEGKTFDVLDMYGLDNPYLIQSRERFCA